MSSRTEELIPVEHDSPCFSGAGMIGKKWGTYWMLDGGKNKQWYGTVFKTAKEAIAYSMAMNQANDLRQK